MSDNNLNKDHSWKSRLAEMESLPGETRLDKKASWNTLHARIQDQPASKKRYWYWAAAAGLLLISILPFTHQKKQASPIAKQQPDKVYSDPAIIKITTANDQLTQLSLPAKKELSVAIAAKKNPPAAHHNIQTFKQPVIVETTPVITILASTPVIDSNKTYTAVVLPKKKLSIVHINELSVNNGSPAVGISFSNTLRRFIRPSNKDMSIGIPANNSSNGDHILIQNINPQNQH